MKLILILVFLIYNFILNINCENVLKVLDVKLAQTHVISISGKSWNLQNKTQHMSLIGDRRALLLASFEDPNQVYYVSVWFDSENKGSLKLNDPSNLPPTEDNGEKFSTVHHSIMLPREWVMPKMKFHFFSMGQNDTIASDFFYPDINQNYTLKMWTLPFYLFGANDTNTQPFSSTMGINTNITSELKERWSCSELIAENHPIKRIDWPYLVMEPRNGDPAMLITNSDQKKDGYAIMNGVLKILTEIREAFGESTSSIQIYSPLLQLGANGKYADPYGGLGGGSRGTGDYKYSFTFFHEQGHAMGLPHAGEAYNAGKYPYVNGSLLGCEWGYDANHNEFLGTFIPPTSDQFKKCRSHSVFDSKNRCVKQSVMQGGAGDYSSKYRYSMFADFEMTTIQNYFKDSIYYNEIKKSYVKWNDTSKSYSDYRPATKNNGLWGLDDGTPIERDVDVYTIIFTYSTVGPSELSQVYPILKSKGNLMRRFDPTNKTDMVAITPSTGSLPWYCFASGCDYTVRVTFADDSKEHLVLRQGKRQYWKPTGDFKDNLNNPTSSDSFVLRGINIKATKIIKKVELLETLMAWKGISSNATVLVSKTF
ncbi:hypothetical protein RB653_003801 [Dictyostelium firmibasis]|uniref:Peptidase M66 domain-containing protein n=1 Tax=Dictyostelium firmibasis TaxID=79012 RepID=A0AAN7U556_9MYCE